ncbi:MAG: pyridoxamine 5'-phosphate oxidase family protein [Thiohalomonadaceae bacterium]
MNGTPRTDDNSMLNRLLRLLRQRRWAALATSAADGSPMASMVAYVPGDNAGCLYLHLSQLAAHTGNLLANGKAALVIGEEDNGSGDPQELARVTLQGQAVVVARDSEEYRHARERYLERLPASAQLFDFPDFLLFRLDVDSARFVGGFAQARRFDSDALCNVVTR